MAEEHLTSPTQPQDLFIDEIATYDDNLTQELHFHPREDILSSDWEYINQDLLQKITKISDIEEDQFRSDIHGNTEKGYDTLHDDLAWLAQRHVLLSQSTPSTDSLPQTVSDGIDRYINSELRHA